MLQAAVPDVERLVVDEEPDQLAIGHVDDGLADARAAVNGFAVVEWAQLVHGIQITARQAVRLALVEVGTQTDVAVRQREHGLALRQHIEVEPDLANRPGFDRKRVVRNHEPTVPSPVRLSSAPSPRLPTPPAGDSPSRSSARSVTTVSAPCSRSASACSCSPSWSTRSTPTT